MMKIIATPAGEPKIKIVRYIGWVLFAYLVVVCIDQFTSEASVSDSILHRELNVGVHWFAFVAFFTIFFLLGLRASTGMRFVSLLGCWAVAGWLLTLAATGVDASWGPLMNNWTFFGYAALLGLMTWGWWPYSRQKLAADAKLHAAAQKPAKRPPRTKKRSAKRR
jgi:hypothetical protein